MSLGEEWNAPSFTASASISADAHRLYRGTRAYPVGSSGVSNGATGRAGINSPANRCQSDSGSRGVAFARRSAGERPRRGYPRASSSSIRVGGDLFNQCPNVKKIVGSPRRASNRVAQDHFLTPIAPLRRHRAAGDDILGSPMTCTRLGLAPATTPSNMRQAIEPMYECRNDIDIFADLAARVGVAGNNDKTSRSDARADEGAVNDFDAFSDSGLARFPAPEDAVAFAPRSAIPSVTSSRRLPEKSRSLDGAGRRA